MVYQESFFIIPFTNSKFFHNPNICDAMSWQMNVARQMLLHTGNEDLRFHPSDNKHLTCSVTQPHEPDLRTAFQISDPGSKLRRSTVLKSKWRKGGKVE